MTGWPLLRGRTVLLVEDESLVSMLAEDIFEAVGCRVLLAMRLDRALELADKAEIDLAILDVNLGEGHTSQAVAELLVQRRVPFLFVTGYGVSGMVGAFRSCEVVQKPYSASELLNAASRCVQQDGDGITARVAIPD